MSMKRPAAAAEAVGPKRSKKQIKVGDTLPPLELQKGFPPEIVSFNDFCENKKVVLVGLPGAFTPTCSTKSVPGYLAKQDELKKRGVTDVVVYCVNDGATMIGWGKTLGIEDSMISLMQDPSCSFTTKLGLVLDAAPVMQKLGNPRCKRFSMLIEKGMVQVLNVAEGPNDPSGDGNPTVSFVEKMLEDIDEIEAEKKRVYMNVKVGSPIPHAELQVGFPPMAFRIAAYCKGKKVILLGLPGAFTPTCSTKTVPGYMEHKDELVKRGVTDVLVCCVNDGAVMTGWAKNLGVEEEGSMFTFVADTHCDLTKKLGLVLDEEGVMVKLGNPRCKRYSMFIDDGIIRVINVAASQDDPTGDISPTVTFVQKMLEDIDALAA